jgi:hypothetical protein
MSCLKLTAATAGLAAGFAAGVGFTTGAAGFFSSGLAAAGLAAGVGVAVGFAAGFLSSANVMFADKAAAVNRLIDRERSIIHLVGRLWSPVGSSMLK